jgi:peptidoglycan/LPS O-acetylase OafA/YrhL
MPALTSLRFFLAALVAAYHWSGQSPSDWLAWSLPQQAVSCFFVLSGFVLQHSYGGDLRGAGYAAFATQRVARIWPLHALVVVAIIAVVPPAVSDPTHAWRALTLTHAWSTERATFYWAPEAPSWSLSVELFFYLSFPLLTAPVRRRPIACLGLAVAGLAAYVSSVRPGPVVEWTCYVFPLVRLPEFVLGMAAAEALPALARWKRSTSWWTAVESLALGALIVENVAAARWLPWISSTFGEAPAMWVKAAGCAPAAAFLVLSLGVGRGRLSRALLPRPLVLAGEASFALYMLHWPMMLVRWGNGWAFAAAACAASLAAHKLIEAPVYAAAKRLLARVAVIRRIPMEAGSR